MADLPFQPNMIVPVQWQTAIAKNTIQTGSFPISGTIGFHPWQETATLTWILNKSDAASLQATLKLGMYNATYDYQCNTRGPVKVRPLDALTFEEKRGTQMIQVTLNVVTVSL